MMVAFWDGEGQGLNLFLGLILAFSLIFSPELTLAFLLGLFLYICLGLGVSNETPEVPEHMEFKKAKELNEMGAACPAMVESAPKEKEKEEMVEEDMGILISDVRAISQYEFDHLEEIYQETGSNENNQTKEKRWSEKVSKDPDPGYPGTFS